MNSPSRHPLVRRLTDDVYLVPVLVLLSHRCGAKRVFYASSACIYPEHKQTDVEVEGGGLKESDAWPAAPQDAYGLEKLASEEIYMHYGKVGGVLAVCRRYRFVPYTPVGPSPLRCPR